MPASDVPGPGPATALAPVIMLRPIRTLVLARDLAFRQRAITVLRDLGPVAFAIVDLGAPERVIALIREQRADVVVLDITGCAPAAAGVLTEIRDRAPMVGVVVVSDEVEVRSHANRALPKWGWASELTQAVQHVYRRDNRLNEETPHVNQRYD
ncbi:MAG: hypothetical protein ACRDKY_14025 [Solirubrobacteraceae bacterium]